MFAVLNMCIFLWFEGHRNKHPQYSTFILILFLSEEDKPEKVELLLFNISHFFSQFLYNLILFKISLESLM